MKRALPLFLLFAVLGAVALVLIQPGGDTGLETPIAKGVTPSSAPEEQGALETFEDTLSSAASSEREAAPGIGGMTAAGDLRGNGTTLRGQLVTPVGSPRDPSLRVVAISLEGALEEAYVQGLVELNEASPALAKEKAQALKLRNDGPYEGRPYSVAELRPDGSFSFQVSQQADAFYLLVEGRYLYLEDPWRSQEELDEGRTYRIEPLGGACLTVNVTPPSAAGSNELIESLPRMVVELNGSESGGMMGRFQSEESRTMVRTEDGRYEARALPTALFWTGEVDTPDYVNSRTNALKLKPGEDAQLEVKLDMGGRISGVVLTENGEPLEGAELSARPANDTRFWMGGGESTKAESEDDGSFELRGVQAGEVRLTVSLDGYLPPEPSEFELNEAEERGGLQLVMSDGLAIRGTVLWPDGSPVQGASVGVETGEESTNRWGRNNKQLWVETDERGAFLLTGLNENDYRIRANSDDKDGSGRWRGVITGVDAGTSGVVIKLEEPGLVKGRLAMSSGAPLPEGIDALVDLNLVTVSESDASVKSKHGNIYQAAKIQADGSFQISGVYPAEYEVNLSSASYVHSDSSQRHIYPSGELIVNISQGGIISGILLDPLGSPAPGCEITASTGESSGRPSWGGGSRGDANTVTSEEDGSFKVEGLKPGSYKLTAKSNDWGPTPEELVRIEEGQVVAGLTLQLVQGGTIIGTVYNKDGSSVAGRTISVGQGGFMGMGGDSGGEATTDESGRFSVNRLAPGTYQVSTQPTMEEIEEVMGEGQGGGGGNWTSMMSLIETVTVDVADGETVEVVLGAPPAAPVLVYGRVLEGDQPITTGTVLAVADGQGFMQGSSTANIDSSGRYEMSIDAPGDYVLLVQGSGSRGFGIDFPVTFPEVERFEFDLLMPASVLEGVVIGTDGRGAAGENVLLRPASQSMGMGGVSSIRSERCDEDGSFYFDRMRPGTYVVQAGGRSWRDEPSGAVSLTIELGESERANVRLELSEPGTVEGTVINSSGEPVEGATVFFRTAAGTVQTSRNPVISDSDGSFRHNGLGEGTVTAVARTSAGSTQESGPIQVRSGGTSIIELTIEEGTLLRCVCEDSDGNSMRASISVLDEAGREQSSLKTREQWTQVFTGGGEQRESTIGPLPPGKYKVIFTTDDGQTADRTVRLTGRAERKVRVRIRD